MEKTKETLFLIVMQMDTSTGVLVETITLPSEPLERTVTCNVYLPANVSDPASMSLLLINDGQDIEAMGFDKMLHYFLQTEAISPLLCVGIHCGEDRLNEYGMAASPDFKGRGAKGAQYQRFITEELLPDLYSRYHITSLKQKAIAGFSMGGLSALDTAWNHPDLFTMAGIFSGSLWWRSKDKLEKDYNEHRDRLMHRQIREGAYHPGLKFFFECGEQDEQEDRNRNGVIDSIDDTIDLMKELVIKGYREGKDIGYLQMPDGKHDVVSWAKALPAFLQWGWGK